MSVDRDVNLCIYLCICIPVWIQFIPAYVSESELKSIKIDRYTCNCTDRFACRSDSTCGFMDVAVAVFVSIHTNMNLKIVII